MDQGDALNPILPEHGSIIMGKGENAGHQMFQNDGIYKTAENIVGKGENGLEWVAW